jgi:anti-sigma factor RsiW
MTAAFEDHLNLDAIVAYADGEMTMGAFQRAAAHVSRCPQCESEVSQQVLARSWLRAAGAPSMPTSLLDTLKSIPVVVPTGRTGLEDSISTIGRPVADDSRSGHHRNWRFRFLGAGAVVAGLAVGSLAVAAAQPGSTIGPSNGHLVSGVTTPFVAPVNFRR